MLFNRQSQLDEDSRKEYIKAKIIPYIPNTLKEHYIEKIPAVVDMYAGSDAEVISIIEDAVRKDSKTNQCLNLEMILAILVDNSTKRRTEVLGECHKILNINHSAPKRDIIVPAIHHTKSIKENLAKPIITKNQINEILAYCA